MGGKRGIGIHWNFYLSSSEEHVQYPKVILTVNEIYRELFFVYYVQY